MSIEITVEDLWWKYNPDSNWILKGLNLEVKSGEFLVITGPADAGRTTLCKCLIGLIPEYYRLGTRKGKVEFRGEEVKKTGVTKVSRNMGMVFEDPESQFFGMTVVDEIVFGMENLGLSIEEMSERMKWALNVVRLDESFLEKTPYQLSGGQKQRIAIASVLAMHPKLLILDDPTSELDPIGKKEVFQTIQEMKKVKDITVVLVSNLAEEIVKYADRVVLLDEGQIKLEGSPAEFFSNVDYLIERGVFPPEVTELSSLIEREYSIIGKKLPLTLDSAHTVLDKILK